jgi:Ca2+-binding EF-hand superfamily protein
VVDIMYMKYDRNKNGLLEAHELKVMLTELYKDGHIDKIPSDTEINSYIAQMDKDKNGKISKN